MKRIIFSSRARLIFVLLYIILITFMDVYSYGIVYQQKIKQENYSNTFWSWVFKESGKEEETEHITVPTYRIIQKSIEIAGILLIFYFCGIWSALGLIISHYLLSYDLLFYLILNKTYLFAEFQKYNSTYWLQNWYQVGYFALNPFNPVVFCISGTAGIIIALLFPFIRTKRERA